MKIAICIPSQDDVKAGFCFDLARMMSHYSATRCGTERELRDALMLFNHRGTLIADQRDVLVKEALKSDCDAVLWLDADMRFPKDALDRLLAHDKPIVAANYTTRRPPFKPVAFSDFAKLERVWTKKDSTGLERVQATGMGCMLVRKEVYEALKAPYHMIGYSPASGQYSGEDMYFGMNATKAGFDVLIDHDLSKDVKHAGTLEFSFDMTPEWDETNGD